MIEQEKKHIAWLAKREPDPKRAEAKWRAWRPAYFDPRLRPEDRKPITDELVAEFHSEYAKCRQPAEPISEASDG